MTGQEFFDLTKDITLFDYDLNKPIDVIHVKAGGAMGQIRDAFIKDGAIIFASANKEAFNSWRSFDLTDITLDDVRNICKDNPNYTIYFASPSMGVFTIDSVKKAHYDYSEDGDGVYDVLEISCPDEPVFKSLDSVEKIDADYYDELFESVYINSKNLRMLDKSEE